MATLEFFFDFASPFAYLAHCRVPALADQYRYELVYRPIDLFAAKVAAGNTGPATVQIPPKFRYISQDLMRWAKKYDIPFVLPFSPKPGSSEPPKKIEITPQMRDSTLAHKGIFFALEQGRAREYATAVFQATFGSGHLVGEEGVLKKVVEQLGWSTEEFFEFIQSEEVANRYDEANKDAQSHGVFGVPTMIVDAQMWWGNDRLSFVEEYLAEHSVGLGATGDAGR